MKAFLIARVSTEEQREAGNSLPAQVARLESYCKNRGFTIADTFSFDESAYKNQRDEFDRILDRVLEQKEKIAVCCDKVDRLSRNVFDKRISLLYEKALNDEIELHFVSDRQIVNSRISAAEKFQFQISLGLAKYYSDAISDNVKRSIEQKIRKGEWPGRAPYGYQNITLSDEKTDITVDEHAAYIVQKAFEFYSSGAYSLVILCTKLKDEYGVDWKPNYLDKIFKNPFYCGEMIIKGKQYPHKYPPIISKELFEQVQQVKKGFNKKKFKYAGKPYIYRGLFRCATCGLAITPEKHKGHIYYHCTQYNGKHGAQWLREEYITEQLSAFFKQLKIPKDILELTIKKLEEVHKNKIEFQTQQSDKLNREKKEITKMMDNLYLDKLKGAITSDVYERFCQSFITQLEDIKSKQNRLDEAEKHYYIAAKYLLEIAEQSHDLFKSSEVEEKRALIKFVLSNLTVDGKNIFYDVQKPFDVLLKCSEEREWRTLLDYFRTFTLANVDVFKIKQLVFA